MPSENVSSKFKECPSSSTVSSPNAVLFVYTLRVVYRLYIQHTTLHMTYDVTYDSRLNILRSSVHEVIQKQGEF